MRRMVDAQGRTFVDRGLGWVALGQPSTPVICPSGYYENPAPFASEPRCLPSTPGTPPVCPSWTTWSDKRKLCDLPHNSYGMYGVGAVSPWAAAAVRGILATNSGSVQPTCGKGERLMCSCQPMLVQPSEL